VKNDVCSCFVFGGLVFSFIIFVFKKGRWLHCCVYTTIKLCSLNFVQIILKKKLNLKNRLNGKVVIGIFHPYCNAGGGGERVLWCAVRAIQSQYPDAYIAVYTGDSIPSEELLQNAFQKFNVRIQNNNIEFITLHKRGWVEAKRYPHFTLLGQSIGSLVLGAEAIFKLVPGVYNLYSSLLEAYF
jgi:alpha-1,2-mannosyltransferase